jgi:ferredoxin-NADP reductase
LSNTVQLAYKEKYMRHDNHNMPGHVPPKHSMPSKKKTAFEVALKEKKQIAAETYAFTFEKPKGFHFRAGQHVKMTLLNPAETDSEGKSRFFSLANSPQETDLVIAVRMRQTAFKRALERMQIGDKVLIEMLLDVPHGAFELYDDPSRPAVFLIGGIGIVPALSMIKDAVERKLPHTIFLFYSNRRPEDAPFLDELEELAKQHPSFKLIPTMTQPEKSTQSWRGETGHINYSMLKRYVENLQSPIYYIAGLPEMVSAMRTLLTDSGVNEEDIRAEEFSGFKMDHNDDIINHA